MTAFGTAPIYGLAQNLQTTEELLFVHNFLFSIHRVKKWNSPNMAKSYHNFEIYL
jgi:hypothetical protein